MKGSRGHSSGKKEEAAAGNAGNDGEDDDRAGASLDKVRNMLAPLGRDEKARLFDMISRGGLKHERMERLIARLLVEQLNGARAEHARRLWTGWFDPVLLRDDLSLLADERLPGSLHIVEASAWWFTLSGPMAPLPGRIQDAIAERGRNQPLEHVFATPEALGWSEELRQRTLAALAAVRAKPAVFNRLIADANAHRARLIKDRGLPVTGTLTPADLDALEAMLRAAPAWKGLGMAAAAAMPGDLARFTTTLIEEERCDAEGAALLALGHLHARRDAGFARMPRHACRLPVFRDAVLAQLRFAAQLLRHGVGARFLGRTTQFQPFLGDLDPRTLRERLFAWYDAAHTLGIDHDERAGPLVADILGKAIDLVEGELIPAVSRQILAMTPRTPPQPAIEPVEFVQDFLADVRRYGFACSAKPWLPTLGTHVAGLFRSLVTTASQQPDPEQSLSALSRLVHLGDLLGAPVEVSAINSALITVVGGALRQRNEFDALEMQLIDRVIAKSQDERRRSKWWVSSEISGLLEIVDRTSPCAPAPPPKS